MLDPLAAVFGGNENDRALTRPFLAHLNAWAARTGAAVLLVAHPPKTGAPYSGSTDWLGGVRAPWTLTTEAVGGFDKPKEGEAQAVERCLTLAKASYGRDGMRAWLRLRDEADGDRTTALAWRECGPVKAAETGRPGRGNPCRSGRRWFRPFH